MLVLEPAVHLGQVRLKVAEGLAFGSQTGVVVDDPIESFSLAPEPPFGRGDRRPRLPQQLVGVGELLKQSPLTAERLGELVTGIKRCVECVWLGLAAPAAKRKTLRRGSAMR